MPTQTIKLPLHQPLLRGERRPRVALIGRPRVGKSSIFQAAASVAVAHQPLASVPAFYEECVVALGLEEISLIDLPSIDSLHRLREADRALLKLLLWGDDWPTIAQHEAAQPVAAFAPPDVLVLVVDGCALARDLELALELAQLGRPLVLALNRVDEARERRLYLRARELAEKLGVPVLSTVAHMGLGVHELLRAALEAARQRVCPLPQEASPHLAARLADLAALVSRPEIETAFRVPQAFLVTQLAENDDWFLAEIAAHFPGLREQVLAARAAAGQGLPRSISEELHADRHHRAATLAESVEGHAPEGETQGWRGLLDALFLHPRWGLIGSLVVFALVLFMVFEVSAVLDQASSARLAQWAQGWQPQTAAGVAGRAVADGLIGLIGIVIPYMLPLVLLLVALEHGGIMHRVAFVVDRGFHRLGLHGGVAVPFLIGLGCNVPAIAAAGRAASGRDRVVAALLITFVPCSARSAIVLAVGGKYLGGLGVLGIFGLSLFLIALLGRLLARRYAEVPPGRVLEIPPYALPKWRPLLRETWARTQDIVTIVLPLLVMGSVVLALLAHVGVDRYANTLLAPITQVWLGLPVVLGVPILFGILRKELSLLMVFQALGTQDLMPALDAVQLTTFLVFLMLYLPCISTFAIMLRVIGRREALFSVALSIGVALLAAGVTRAGLEGLRLVAGS